MLAPEMTQKRMLFQKIQRHELYCPMTLPTGTFVFHHIRVFLLGKGGILTPMFVSSAHVNAPMARNFGRSLSVVMSLMITVAKVRHPPPPSP
jgi:hypothetical protein